MYFGDVTIYGLIFRKLNKLQKRQTDGHSGKKKHKKNKERKRKKHDSSEDSDSPGGFDYLISPGFCNYQPGCEVIKPFLLNSKEHDMSNAYKN